MKITLISDTHTQHDKLRLPGGDLLIFAGDFMSSGYSKTEVINFLGWLDEQPYDFIVFIAGNHDRWVENFNEDFRGLLTGYKNIEYLQDEWIIIDGVKIYGTPWQPWFHNWAFNLQRGEALQKKWDMIPEDADILITHSPPFRILDKCEDGYRAGCENLLNRLNVVKPKINVFGHIHEACGHVYQDGTHFFNASVLDARY